MLCNLNIEKEAGGWVRVCQHFAKEQGITFAVKASSMRSTFKNTSVTQAHSSQCTKIKNALKCFPLFLNYRNVGEVMIAQCWSVNLCLDQEFICDNFNK